MKRLIPLILLLISLLVIPCYAGDDQVVDLEIAEVPANFPNLKYNFCITNDFSFLTFPQAESDYVSGIMDEDVPDFTEDLNVGTTEYLANALGLTSMYFIRIDFSMLAKLNPNTNFYYLMALRILDQDSGAQDDFSYTLLQAELEHTIADKYRFRLGRLAEKYSVSRFFARVALGYKDSHVWGRTPFVNDSVELNLDSKNTGLPVDLITGVKFDYRPLEFTNWFFITKFARNKFQSYFIYTFNMQFEEDLVPLFPWFEGDRYFHAVEMEFALKLNGITPYLNAGVLIDYIGPAPHYSGPTDILKGNQPIIYDLTESKDRTLIPMCGVKLEPWKYSSSLGF
ncbi:hypothetical protein KAU33_03575, partial [Candidatus Dependentiae bacterium]|nr:hypothetical protein [Candidatus Dependentiae bacterium]